MPRVRLQTPGMNATCRSVLSYATRHMARVDSLLQKYLGLKKDGSAWLSLMKGTSEKVKFFILFSRWRKTLARGEGFIWTGSKTNGWWLDDLHFLLKVRDFLLMIALLSKRLQGSCLTFAWSLCKTLQGKNKCVESLLSPSLMFFDALMLCILK